MNNVADYLRTIRQARKVSQTDLGNAIGLSKRQIVRWETGQSGWIKPDALFQACDYLRASATDVLTLIRQPDMSGVDLAHVHVHVRATSNRHTDAQVVHLTTHDPADVEQFLRTLPNAYVLSMLHILTLIERNPSLLPYLIGYVRGRLGTVDLGD